MLTIYKASAGSGKTYTLAKEYLHTLLAYKDQESGRYRLRTGSHHSHRAILAITFSIKATEEMKRRIVDELSNLAELGRKSDYREDFRVEFGCTDEQLREAAERALHDLLFDFSLFNVSTIDSFFQSVLRSFAREIDLPGNYDIEMDETAAIKIGVGEMFATLNGEPGPKSRMLERWLTLFMHQQVDSGGNFNLLNRGSGVHGQVISTLSKLFNEDFRLDSERVTRYFTEDPERIVEFERQLREANNKAAQTLVYQGKRALEEIERLGLTDQKAVSAHLVSLCRKLVNREFVSSQFSLGKTVVNAKDDPSKRYYAAYYKGGPDPTLDAVLGEMCESVVDAYRMMVYVRHILNNVYTFGLLGFVLDFIAQYRRENNLILISDTNELLRRIIKDDLTPFIYERLGVFLDHFMIDEFQDTSRMQWENMMPLLLESVANSRDNLIIGDEKQCIYRFRNSDPQLLASQAKEDVTRRVRESVRERGIEVADNTNWRSSADVVRFNNTIFPQMARLTKSEETYSNTVQQISPKHSEHAGYVNIKFMGSKKEEYLVPALERMRDEIKRELESGYLPSDIAVLVRNHWEGQAVIDFLLQSMEDADVDFPQFDITSREALRVSASPAVKLIVSVLRLVDTSDSSPSDARRISTRKLAQLVNRYEYQINMKGCAVDDALRKALHDHTDSIDELAMKAVEMDCSSLPSMVELIIDTFITERQRDDQNISISAFQDLVIDYCSRGTTDIHSFLQWWDDKGMYACLATPDDLEALTVITIHASKGLQYRCVHVPFASWKMAESSTPTKLQFAWYDLAPIKGVDPSVMPEKMPLTTSSVLEDTALSKQYEAQMSQQRVDNLNLLYVAFTRAIDELVVSAMGSYKDGAASEMVGTYLYRAVKAASGDGTKWTTCLSSRMGEDEMSLGEPTQASAWGLSKPKGGNTSPMPAYNVVARHNAWALARVDDVVNVYQARERGTFLHEVLSHVSKPEDLDLALRRCGYRIGLDQAALEEYRAILEPALADSRVSRWFTHQRRVLNERTIALGDGEHYRPDRVVWTSDDVIEVIDYKFGERREKRYGRQVAGYMRYIAGLFPGYEVRGYVWYPESGIIDAVVL